MMKTENAGIRRAIELMREMSPVRYLKEIAEEKEKRRRDRAAEDAYVFEQGLELGVLEELTTLVCSKLKKGKPIEVISEELETDPEKIREICEIAKDFAPEYDVKAICASYMDR